MSKRLLYLFGEPGTGKITVARVLQKRLDWRLFWLHDLDAVCRIVGRYPLPRLMDAVSGAVLEELMADDHDIIYVRPSRDERTRDRVRMLADSHHYRTTLVRLTASYDVLVRRVTNRPKEEFRVSDQKGMDRYLDARPAAYADEPTVNTGDKTPGQVADEVEGALAL